MAFSFLNVIQSAQFVVGTYVHTVTESVNEFCVVERICLAKINSAVRCRKMQECFHTDKTSSAQGILWHSGSLVSGTLWLFWHRRQAPKKFGGSLRCHPFFVCWNRGTSDIYGRMVWDDHWGWEAPTPEFTEMSDYIHVPCFNRLVKKLCI